MMIRKDDPREQELYDLRLSLEVAKQQSQESGRRAAEWEAKHAAVVADVDQLMRTVNRLAVYGPGAVLHRHGEVLGPDVLSGQEEEKARARAAGVTLRAIATVCSTYYRSPTRERVELSSIVAAAVHHVQSRWHAMAVWDFLPIDAPRREIETAARSACFEVDARGMPSVFADAHLMLVALRYLLVYALCRTKRVPRLLRLRSARLAGSHVFYVTDSEADLVVAIPERTPRWPATYSPEFAAFCAIVEAHGGMVWKQAVGQQSGAIFFSLPDECSTNTSHATTNPR